MQSSGQNLPEPSQSVIEVWGGEGEGEGREQNKMSRERSHSDGFGMIRPACDNALLSRSLSLSPPPFPPPPHPKQQSDPPSWPPDPNGASTLFYFHVR
jgi:hypothetical protein